MFYIGIIWRHKFKRVEIAVAAGLIYRDVVLCLHASKSALYLYHHFLICWQPLHTSQLVAREPLGCLVFEESEVAALDLAEVAMHG